MLFAFRSLAPRNSAYTRSAHSPLISALCDLDIREQPLLQEPFSLMTGPAAGELEAAALTELLGAEKSDMIELREPAADELSDPGMFVGWLLISGVAISLLPFPES